MDCVSHGFFTYFVTFSKWWLCKYGESESWNYSATIFFVAFLGQLILVIGQSHRQRQIFRATRHILTEGVQALPADCSKSLRQMLDLYGLHQQLSERLFRLTVCGLFELNNDLLFGIVQTIIIYTIILIQFDKIINK
ncbi:GH16979 [Drosophila grimshawi]|uniref:GH16979 n=1 Tax=Drosophila grimshawi TaxID=7222 RepID=B4IYG1_DROGR|nr:GH16979 [Drosophila grimshawi]